MIFTETTIKGMFIIEPDVFLDERGFFIETYHLQRFREHGVKLPFVQDNHSRSAKGILRGLHYQLNHPQGKLVRVTNGEVFDVGVDIRKGSPTFGKWFGQIISEENKLMMYFPPGLAHGFCVLSEYADFIYKCTDFYRPEDEKGLIWNEPEIGIEWPITDPILSKRDEANPSLGKIDFPMYRDVLDS
ncbi:dTDP-4-dehydrorhamnose 3,5-epimerase [Calditrichota bacterium]